jgi:hypothetical protein
VPVTASDRERGVAYNLWDPESPRPAGWAVWAHRGSDALVGDFARTVSRGTSPATTCASSPPTRGLALVIGFAATFEFVLRYLLARRSLLLAAGAIVPPDLIGPRRRAPPVRLA